MTMTNAEITAQIILVDEKIKFLFDEMNKHLKAPNQTFIDANAMLKCLLYNPNINRLTNLPDPINLDQLNYNYLYLITSQQLLIAPVDLIKKSGNDEDNATLARAIEIHIQAIAYGFKDVYLQQKAAEIKERLNLLLAEMQRVQTVNPQTLVELLSANENHKTQPLTLQKLCENYATLVKVTYLDLPQTLIEANMSWDDLEQITPKIMTHLEAIRLNQPTTKSETHTSLLENVAGTLLYPIGQLYHRIEEMCHSENLKANTVSIGITALATWQGYVLGAMLAASFFVNPIIGAVCTGLLATTITLAATKWGEKIACQTFNSDSAINSDPRFSLTYNESSNLYKKGFDTDVVREAIRECAIEFNKQPSNSLVFWKPSPQTETLRKLRALKAGSTKDAKLTLNGKFFKLMDPIHTAMPAGLGYISAGSVKNQSESEVSSANLIIPTIL